MSYAVVNLDAIKLNGWATPAVVLTMVAELRAAREVVKYARRANHAVDLIGTTDYSKQCLGDLDDAIRAYDKAVES